VALYDVLFTERSYQHATEEKREFIFMLHAAQKAQQDGRISDSVRVLEGYWPRFLIEYAPRAIPAVAQQPPAGNDAEAGERSSPPESPSFLRRLWPGKLR
jgi:hypothetical protein